MDWTKVLFDPNGRIGQREFWIGVLIIVVGKRLHDAGKTAWLHAIPWGISILLTIVAVALFGGALFSMILNSAGSGADPTGEDIAMLAGAGGGAALLMLLGTVVWIAYTIWVGVLKPDPGSNQYGPAPVLDGRAEPISRAGEDTSKG